MKKFKPITICCSILLTTQYGQAQVVNKSSIIGGINISGQSYGNIDSTGGFRRGKTQLNFAPTISYGLAKNTSIGAYMLLNNSNGSNFNFSRYNHDFAIGVFTRRYINISKKLYAYGQLDLQYATAGGVYNRNRFVNRQINLNLSAGLGYKISNRLLLELGANNLASLRFYNGGNGGGLKSNNLIFNGPSQANGLHIGLSYKFR
jgi:hypothetical protein